ncbi:flippase [Priestia megaterium]|uniref:flippase n=1 Tax=Priestia megaterium TaxID=1404 RepID=UPI002E1BED6A|nr:flippase [Priestia megaterium]
MKVIEIFSSKINFKKSVLNKINRNMASNTLWLFFDKIFRMGVGFLVYTWIARYLGPTSFGKLTYAQAFVSLFSAIATLGLDGIVIRNLVRYPNKKDEIIGTTFILRLLSALFMVMLVFATIKVVNPQDSLLHALVLITALGTIFQAFSPIDFWYESQMKTKFFIIPKNFAFTLIAIVNVCFIIFQANLMIFAITALVEIILGSIFTISIYKRHNNKLLDWKPSVLMAKELLKDSWPLIISGMAVVLYMRIDQVMIKAMLGEKELGYYSASSRLAELWYFIPTVIVSSTFPLIVKLKSTNEFMYYKRLQNLYNILTWVAIIIGIVVMFLSEIIVNLLFGEGYNKSASVLSISIWASVFVFQGVARGNWIRTENLQHYTYWYTLSGCAVNIVLNLFFIKYYGIAGAAFATLISQCTVAIIAPAIFKKTRLSSKMIIKSFFWGKHS